jgi:transposase
MRRPDTEAQYEVASDFPWAQAGRSEEVIRVSQWAEVRHMHEVEGIAKKEVARRLGLDIKTVRRALKQSKGALTRRSPARGRVLDPLRERIVELLRLEPELTAKRVRRLLEGSGPVPGERAVRKYIAALRADLFAPKAFVHRTHLPGATSEFDFGESSARIAGKVRRIKYMISTLPSSNVYFAKAYPVERLECLLDGMLCAFRYFGGVTKRGVLDNTSLAVREVLRGPDRIETRAFAAFRGAFPLRVDFCAPGSGWEKGSVERGVEYVRDIVFRPMPEAASFDALNAMILVELERDLDQRRLPDGRTARVAWIAEREHLRPLPAYVPETCRIVSVVADKFAHVRVDRATYSVPIRYARRALSAKLFHDRIEFACDERVISTKARTFEVSAMVLDPLDVLPLLEHKHRAVGESTAIQQWDLPASFHELRAKLLERTRKGDQEWVRVMRLLESHEMDALTAAVEEALMRGSPSLATIRMLLERSEASGHATALPAIARPELLSLEVPRPRLEAWDEIVKECR